VLVAACSPIGSNADMLVAAVRIDCGILRI